MKTILIIDDDPAITTGLEEVLRVEHFTTKSAATGEGGLRTARRENIDLILLDLKLPDINGEDICRELRKEGNQTPILMLTSKKSETDKVIGLEIGADDYVTKPFSTRELVARVNALLRRSSKLRSDLENYSFADVEIDFRKQEAKKNGKPVQFSVREFAILKYLILHEGEVISRDALLNDVWGYEQFPTTRTVDNQILSLRKKIEDVPSKPAHLLTVHTAGYKFVKEKQVSI